MRRKFTSVQKHVGAMSGGQELSQSVMAVGEYDCDAEPVLQAADKSLVLEFSDDSDDMTSESESEDEDEDEDDNMMFYERAVRDISSGDSYVCMICTVEMDYTCRMFACPQCYRVFDYDCIREWAIKSTSKTVEGIWKCPNCYFASKKVPRKDRPTCWCGKVVKPDPNPLDPNSCGQTCDAPICRHGCSKVCHLGPHPPCTRIIGIRCRCGKHMKDVTCCETRGSSRPQFSCDEKCGMLFPCGIHRCEQKCHSGLCGPCKETLVAKDGSATIRCYCGLQKKDTIKCNDVRVAEKDSMDESGEKWVGVFACPEIRTVQYSCGLHSFVESCRAGPAISKMLPCPFSPQLLKTCPCGRTLLNELGNNRKNCTDYVPTCESRCGKPLPCGKHTCPFTCHSGDCMDPCTQFDKISCQCESKHYIVPCQFKQKARCHTKCESLMSCRRHRCIERCCSGKPSAEKRMKTPFSSRELQDETLVEAEHICLKDCNLTLSCGIHKCRRKCHPGKCPPCLESDPNDLVCPCGKTVVTAPVRCGVRLPPCPYPCISVVRDGYPCGHKPMPHCCHPVEEPCPPCTASVFKPCKCGKKSKVRTLCFQQDVSCGQICNKPLTICHHTCQKKCHDDSCQTKCRQICKKRRMNCDHKCPKPCHGKANCPDLPCSYPVIIKCACGRKETNEPCGSNSERPSATFTRLLPCDEECERVKRCAELKKALGLTESESSKIKGPESSLALLATTFEELDLPFTESALSVYSSHQKYCDGIETILNDFIDNKGKNSLHFKPMRPAQRHFVHELAKAYKLYSESQDREPKRSVYVKKESDGQSGRPAIMLNEALPIYQAFKQREKENKLRRSEMQSVTKLVNYTPKHEPTVELAKFNGFLVRNLTKGTTEHDLERAYDEHLRCTLVKDPIYKMLPKGNTALIFPTDYANVTMNTERDMERLVGHFDFICKESFIGDGVELCQVDEHIFSEIPQADKMS
ncbi:ZYBA0S04-06216g1_1 [Zygosaccharomyces bailii CLIB 213]|uniref:ZYBA0S04-06216g1_1 n=1 Tax=Zygosaccharomyces bailii (strain CLIB 213 / ATCC 58445 / CBS 680 / BCRC 21525 / NBRC 1098 / NCYC 1416 / NRRL Y-2227) TaxID=1333698 RepID=A0A8J2T5V7_ZYGB2|nr:ZYBA0S04-06216g1_1 [Zygosaccharomyces bailii CLIB 213]